MIPQLYSKTFQFDATILTGAASPAAPGGTRPWSATEDIIVVGIQIQGVAYRSGGVPYVLQNVQGYVMLNAPMREDDALIDFTTMQPYQNAYAPEAHFNGYNPSNTVQCYISVPKNYGLETLCNFVYMGTAAPVDVACHMVYSILYYKRAELDNFR